MARSLRKRNRYFLLALAVLPQLISLSGLAGLFWLIRIKEVFSAPGDFLQSAGGTRVVFLLADADRKKLEVGSIIHGQAADAINGQPVIEFRAAVAQITRPAKPTTPPAYQVTAKVQQLKTQGPDGEAILKSNQAINLQMWSRTRRALFVLLEKDNRLPNNPKAGFSNPLAGRP
jgi:hypothetical protein